MDDNAPTNSEESVKEQEDKKGLIDIAVEKLTSRKLLVWIISTTLLVVDKLTPEQWVWVSLVYVGSTAAADIVATIKRAK